MVSQGRAQRAINASRIDNVEIVNHWLGTCCYLSALIFTKPCSCAMRILTRTASMKHLKKFKSGELP